MSDHDIFFDRAGWGDHPRFTCLVCDDSLLKRRFDSTTEWYAKVREFIKKHPCKEADRIKRRMQLIEATKNG